MDLAKTIAEVIDTRSFSSIWYWIVLAAIWSAVSRYTLGVPYDMVVRARREQEGAIADLDALAEIHIRRMRLYMEQSGLWMAGFAAFVLTGLVLLAFYYQIELAQAVVLIFIPMTLVGYLTLHTAQKIEAEGARGEDLIRRLMRHRFWTHVVGMISIFVSAMFGMYHNLAVPPMF